MTDLVGRKNVAVWDDRRNSSRVFDVPPDAIEDAERAVERYARENPRHVAWLAAGAPTVRSDADHQEWFGEPYDRATATSTASSGRDYEADAQGTLL